MRIPSGDLAPARKRRRHHYGRRRSPLPVVFVVLLVCAVAVGVYLLRRGDSGGGAVAAASRCPSTAPVVSSPAPPVPSQRAVRTRLPAPGQVALQLLNGTGRDGLARTVGDELARRGFRVGGMGNAPGAAGPSLVYYGPGGRPAALLVSAHVLGSTVVPVPAAGQGTVRVVLGSTFVRLRSAAEVSAYTRRLTAPAPAARAVGPKPAASPSCR